MIPERGRRPDGDDHASWDPGLVQSPWHFLERKRAFAPFVVTITVLFVIGELDSMTGMTQDAIARRREP